MTATSLSPEPLVSSSPGQAARVGTLMGVGSMSTVQLGSALTVPMFATLGVLGTAGLRLVWAGIVLLVLVRPRRRDFAGRDLAACVGLGVVTAGMMVFFALAIARLPLGTASALEFLGPLAVSLFGPGSGRRVWTVAAGFGVVLLTEPWHGGIDALGLFYALAAAGCWAAYILLTQHVGDRVTGMSGLAVSMPVAAVVAMLVAAPTLDGRLSWGPVLVMLGLAVLSPLVPFALEFLALRRLTASSFGTLMSLEPAIALLIGMVVLHQVPGVGPALGVALVVTAGVGATRSGARPEPAAAEAKAVAEAVAPKPAVAEAVAPKPAVADAAAPKTADAVAVAAAAAATETAEEAAGATAAEGQRVLAGTGAA